jgi:hypothetical protein
MPPSNITSMSPPSASAIFGSAEIEEGAPSSWRPPIHVLHAANVTGQIPEGLALAFED